MKDLQLSGRSSAKFSSRILKLTTSPLTILHTDLSSFLQANLSKPKNLPGRSRPSFDSVAFLHQRHLGLPDKNTTDFAKNTSSNKVHKFFLSPFFFLGGGWIYIYIYIDGGSQKKIQKDIIHPSIYAGEKDASTLHGFTASTLLEAKKRRVDPLSTKN